VLSLRLRIAISYLLLTLAAVVVLGVYAIERVDDDFRDRIEDNLRAEAAIVRNGVLPLLQSGASDAEIDNLAKQLGAETGIRITVIAADGRVLGDSDVQPALLDNHATRPEVQAALSAGEGRSRRDSDTVDEPLSYVAVRADIPGREPVVVRVAQSNTSVDSALDRVPLFAGVAVVAVVALGLGALLSRSILRPLGGIAAAASEMARGELAARVKPRPSGEVGELADAFNHMAATLQEQMTVASQGRSRLTAALNSSVDAVIAMDEQARVLFANEAAVRLFQRPATEIVGNPFTWTLADERIIEAIKASRERGESQVTLIERPGRQFFQVVTTPIREGGDWTVLAVFHDLTDVKRTEQMRRDFVANVSHELRTPLAAINAVIETLADGAIDDKAVANDFLARADAEVDRLALMVEELLELSRIESGEMPLSIAPANVAALLRDVVERLRPQAERKQLTLSLDVDPAAGDVAMDAQRIERAAVNLLHNAIKFTPEGGSIGVSARRDRDQLVIAVADSGIGIAPEERSRVFERFYKADHSRASVGSGLGLALVKHAAEAHGGSVRVESDLGRGSTFSLSIPVEPSP
jgi:two-component system phosphate regulon sensor histidine kinase PhoR